MGLDPATGKFHKLRRVSELLAGGSSVPESWSVFSIGERVLVKGHIFKVVWIGGSAMTLEPVPLLVKSKPGE